MFDVGFTELMFIGVIALVVIGPERLPAVAKTVGTWVNKMQRFVKGVKTDFASEFESGELQKLIGDQREQINELREMVNTAKKDFKDSSQELVRDANESISSMEDAAKVADETGGDLLSSDKKSSTVDMPEALSSDVSSDASDSKVEPVTDSGSKSTGTGGSS